MFDSKSKELVRRFLYTYDDMATAASPCASRWSRAPRTLRRTPFPPLRKRTPLPTILKRRASKRRTRGAMVPPSRMPSVFSVFQPAAVSVMRGRFDVIPPCGKIAASSGDGRFLSPEKDLVQRHARGLKHGKSAPTTLARRTTTHLKEEQLPKKPFYSPSLASSLLRQRRATQGRTSP